MRFLPHAHRISLLSPAPVSHIFHSCRPSMPRKQKAALVPTPIKQNHEAMVVSYRPQTLHDTIHTVLPGEVLPAIPSYSEFIAVRLFVFQLTASRRGWHRISDILNFSTVISTHSLTKRLTSFRRYIAWFVLFQLTASRRGWRETRRYWGRLMNYFNSQPHEEADDYDISSIIQGWYFNSQPHEEADSIRSCADGRWNISTHSLTKRLTQKSLNLYHSLIFQLTASRRGWQRGGRIWKEPKIFQLTASRRGWRRSPSLPQGCHLFQLTASRRGWHESGRSAPNDDTISTHSLTKRLTNVRCIKTT